MVGSWLFVCWVTLTACISLHLFIDVTSPASDCHHGTDYWVTGLTTLSDLLVAQPTG